MCKNYPGIIGFEGMMWCWNVALAGHYDKQGKATGEGVASVGVEAENWHSDVNLWEAIVESATWLPWKTSVYWRF